MSEPIAQPEPDEGNVENLCTHEYGGTISPPEYCDMEKDPGSEFCAVHRERNEKLERLADEMEARQLAEDGQST